MKGERPVEEIAFYLVKMILPALFGALLWALTRPWRLHCLSKSGRAYGAYRDAAILIFDMFLAGLLALTLTPAGFWEALLSGQMPQFPKPFQGGINLVPIRRSWELLCYYIRNDLWTAFWVNFPGNIVMFMPIGFFAALLMDKPCWWKSLVLSAALSLLIEVFQLFVSRGTDIDDLILNALGGLVGHLCFLAFQRAETNVVIQCAKM